MLSEDRLLPPSAVPHRVVWERPVLALGLRTVGENRGSFAVPRHPPTVPSFGSSKPPTCSLTMPRCSGLAVSAAVDAQDCFGGPHQSCRKHSTVVWPSASWFTAARRTRPSSVGPAGGVQTGLALWSPVDRDFRRSGDLLRSLNAVQQWDPDKSIEVLWDACKDVPASTAHRRRSDGTSSTGALPPQVVGAPGRCSTRMKEVPFPAQMSSGEYAEAAPDRDPSMRGTGLSRSDSSCSPCARLPCSFQPKPHTSFVEA
ncbi:hypothetical protein L1887_60512 [Cichorium endivia]|nr:hypothetical protein L1887_60512 [Cichorium endivia]